MIEIIDYEPSLKHFFANLNLEWIEHYFKVEAKDIEALNQPDENIIAKGGRIFFARLASSGEIVGTVALLKIDETEYELAKMAVVPKAQGLGIGKKLGIHLIEQARALGCKRLFLESNKKLTPALSLYEKLGFKEIPIQYTPYIRADYKAEMFL